MLYAKSKEKNVADHPGRKISYFNLVTHSLSGEFQNGIVIILSIVPKLHAADKQRNLVFCDVSLSLCVVQLHFSAQDQ